MKIFISSVRNGLETERDALPGLIKALGHDPVRFEDFSAQQVPSREACIKAVESSDAYLLLLGPNYGAVFPETGQSATEDEWVTAQRLGKPRFVLRKIGVDFDAQQQVFETTLGDYGSGRFYKSFATVSEVLQAAAGAIRELEKRQGFSNSNRFQRCRPSAGSPTERPIEDSALQSAHVLKSTSRHSTAARCRREYLSRC